MSSLLVRFTYENGQIQTYICPKKIRGIKIDGKRPREAYLYISDNSPLNIDERAIKDWFYKSLKYSLHPHGVITFEDEDVEKLVRINNE